MSSIDDSANGAAQTRYHRNPPEECGRAVRLVCSYAGKDDAMGKHDDKEAERQQSDGEVKPPPDADTVREPKPNPHSDE